MKINHLLLAGIAGITLFSCSEKDDVPISKDEVKSISVSLGGITTRASEPTDIITTNVVNVNSVSIYLTDANDNIISTKTVNKDAVTNSDWDKLTDPVKGLKFINIPQSVSKVFIYGNPGSAVANNIVNTKLAEQQGNEVLYYGMDNDLQPIADEPINPTPVLGKTYTAQITIVPIVARLQITSISFKGSGSFNFTRTIDGSDRTATVSWSGFTGNIKGLYMNNFYNVYNNPGTLETLLLNTTFDGHIQDGMWTFDASPTVDAAAYASYAIYNQDGTYGNLPLDLNGKCYAFNFFPGTAIPQLHFDISDVVISGLASTDTEVYNPAVETGGRFINILGFYKDAINTPMTAADFVPGTLYNMAIELIPILDTDLKNVQYNVMVHVTVAPWNEQTIYPGFEQQV